MAQPLSRRTLLQVSALVAAAGGTGVAVGGQAAAAQAAWTVRPFGLGDVALQPGLFAEKRALMLDHARGYDVNRLLQVFRANAGLDTGGAVAPGGWEGLDGEANGNLRGHYTGHFLTMLAQAYASTGEEVFGTRIRTMVGALGEVREALRHEPSVLSVAGVLGGTAVANERGSYQYVELPAGVLGSASAVTLSAWVRPAHEDAWARVLDFGDDTTRYLYLAARNANGVPRFAITTGGAGAEQGIDGTAALPLDRWSHLAVTIADGTGTLYVNGTAVARNTAMSLTPAALGTLADHWLGRSHYPADPVFAGAFGGFDVWSRALSAAEIAGLQSARTGGDLVSYAFGETSGSTFADASGRGLDAALRRTWGGPGHPGFLAAYPETQFIALESMTGSDYTKVWAPYYTAHKILRGLLDAHTATGDERALDLASGMGDWMYARLSVLPAATLQRMWGIFSSGEFGGIVEAICDLHELTGSAEHLALARLFDLDSLIDACAANTDTLNGLHANQHIPVFTGLVRLYDATGEERYLTAAKNFWGMVVPHRMYGIGGTSTTEFWKARDVIAGTLSATTAESCCAYNMLKLSRALFFHEQDPAYMDYYERALYNQVLGSKQDGRCREAAGHVLHRADTRARAGLHAQAGHDLLRGHGHGVRDQVPGLGVLRGGRRQRPVRQPLQPVDTDLGREGDQRRPDQRLPAGAGQHAHRRWERAGLLRTAAAGAGVGVGRVPGDGQRACGAGYSGTGQLLRRAPPHLAGRGHRAGVGSVPVAGGEGPRRPVVADPVLRSRPSGRPQPGHGVPGVGAVPERGTLRGPAAVPDPGARRSAPLHPGGDRRDRVRPLL